MNLRGFATLVFEQQPEYVLPDCGWGDEKNAVIFTDWAQPGDGELAFFGAVSRGNFWVVLAR